MAWFTRQKPGMEVGPEGEKRLKTEGLWLKCESCGQIIWKKALDDNLQVCPRCEHHFRLDARTRLEMLFDGGEYEEFDAALTSTDPLHFHDSRSYTERLAAMQEATSMSDALISASGTLASNAPIKMTQARTSTRPIVLSHRAVKSTPPSQPAAR